MIRGPTCLKMVKRSSPDRVMNPLPWDPIMRLYPTKLRMVMFTISLEGHRWLIQLIPLNFSVQTRQLAWSLSMVSLTMVG